MMHEIKVEFIIMGFDCIHEEITSKLGLEPTRITRKGDKISSKGVLEYQENAWILKSVANDNLNLDSHLEDLQKRITPHFEQFKTVCQQYYSEFSCCIYLAVGSEESIPSIHLDKSFIYLIRELNSEVDVDVFMLGSE